MSKVVIAGDFPFPSGTAASVRLKNLAHGFVQLGFDVEIISFINGGEPQTSARFAKNIVMRPALIASGTFRNKGMINKVRWLIASCRKTHKAYHEFRKILRQGDVNLVLLYGRSFLRLWPFVRASREAKVPVILDCVESKSSFKGFGGSISPIYWDWSLGEWLLPKVVDGMSVITKYLSDRAEANGCNQICIVPAAEDFSSQPPCYSVSSGSFNVAYVGALLPRDNPVFLADLMDYLEGRFPRIILHVAGKYESVPEARPQLDRLRVQANKGNVRLWGKLPDDELAAFIANADALILPRRDSLSEIAAFPTRLAECLRTGRPVLACAVGDIPLYLRDGVDAILLDTYSPAAAADKVLALAQTSDRGAKIGRMGFLRGRDRFDRLHHASALIGMAKAICEEINGAGTKTIAHPQKKWGN